MDNEQLFFALHEGLPRQGPGSDARTRKALESVVLDTNTPNILDIGCGPGMQTRVLSRRFPEGAVTAVDLYQLFLDQLKESMRQEGLTNISLLRASMDDLPFEPESFDLIWSEGAAYIMGFPQALEYWHQFLKPGGYCGVSELCWLKHNPPKKLREFWEAGYPAITDIQGNIQHITSAGYELISSFILPSKDWETHYYTPLLERIAEWRQDPDLTPEAAQVLHEEEEEISIFRTYRRWYSYVFFIMKKLK